MRRNGDPPRAGTFATACQVLTASFFAGYGITDRQVNAQLSQERFRESGAVPKKVVRFLGGMPKPKARACSA